MQPLDLFAARDRRRSSDPAVPVVIDEDAPLFLGGRILDHDVEHEAIELRLGQRIGAFLLDRILRREHEQRPLEVVADAGDGDLVFLHRLEQRRLRLRRRAVDLVGEDDVGEDRPADEPDDALAGRAVLLDHFRAEDVGRHQVGRELDAVEPQVDGLGELLDEQRLGQPGNAAQQAVPAGEKRDQDLADDPLLADDRLGQLALEPPGHLGTTSARREMSASISAEFILAVVRCRPQSKWQSLPTEQINPASLAIDKAPVRDIIDLVINEDRKVIAAVQKEKEKIAHGIEIITQSLRKGGRVIFIGAGTSGRLGVVEAAEMPPTFGTPPRIVQGIMAGGQAAVFQAKEGVEDNYEEGGRSIGRLRLSNRDVVIGVSASGITPFVRGGLTRARKAGAKIIFVTCWPGSELQNFVDLIIAPVGRPGDHRRLDPAQGRHRDQDGAQHADHRLDDQVGQDLRQPDGGRADRIREAQGPREADPRRRDRARAGRRRGAAQAREAGT